MKPANIEVEVVLEAADEWVAALEALVAAKQASGATEAEQEAVDIAGSHLVLAVTRWRSKRAADYCGLTRSQEEGASNRAD